MHKAEQSAFYKGESVKQKSIKMYKKKTNLKISLNNLEKIE